MELGRYDEALARLEPYRAALPANDRPPRIEVVWAAAILARARDLLVGPGASPWDRLSRLRGDVVRDLMGGLTVLARAAARAEALADPLDRLRTELLAGRVYALTPRFLELHPVARDLLDRVAERAAALSGTPHDPGLGVLDRLAAIARAERARL